MTKAPGQKFSQMSSIFLRKNKNKKGKTFYRFTLLIFIIFLIFLFLNSIQYVKRLVRPRAGMIGFEPTTHWLTASCTTVVLHANMLGGWLDRLYLRIRLPLLQCQGDRSEYPSFPYGVRLHHQQLTLTDKQKPSV